MTEVSESYLMQINPPSPVDIPYGFSRVKIWAIGAGGSGKSGAVCAGGGAGGVAVKTYTILDTEWNTTLTVSYGTGAYDANGGDSTVDGTMNGSTITQLKGGGGGKAGTPSVGSGGAAGSASGGDNNYPGEAGQEYDSENDICGLGGVIDVAAGSLFGGPSTTGAGGNGDPSFQQGGFDGAVIFEWGVRE